MFGRLLAMKETSARLLRLLSLLQTRRDWSGAELADKLAITPRTVRRDVDRLRDLGYPVDATVGVGGGYRLGAGAEMPPLQLDDEEVLAVALSLQSGATGSVVGIGEASMRALAKLRQIMPSRLRHRLESLSIDVVPREPAASAVDASVLSAIASVCHNHERLRFDYSTHDGTQSRREVEPYRLVRSGVRWYLVAWDLAREDWRSFRVDRMEPKIPTGPRFVPRELPAGGCSRLRFPRCRSGLFLHARNSSTACTHRADSTHGQRTVGIGGAHRRRALRHSAFGHFSAIDRTLAQSFRRRFHRCEST